MNVSRTCTLIIALVATVGLSACGQESDTSKSDDSSSSTATVELTADSSAAGKCAVPSAELLSTFDTAFEGTVTSLDDGTATLAVDHWFAGGDGAETVTVTTPSEDLQDLLLAVDFKADQTYLVSSSDGRVSLCGFSGEKTAELEQLYQSAYAS